MILKYNTSKEKVRKKTKDMEVFLIKLKHKFQIPVIIAIIIAFFIYTGILADSKRVEGERNLQEKLTNLTETILTANTENMWNIDKKNLADTCNAFFRDKEIVCIKIIDDKGIELVNLNRNYPFDITIAKEEKFDKGNKSLGKLEVRLSNQFVKINLYQTIGYYLILCFILIFVVLLITTFTSGAVTNQVWNISETIHKIAAGDPNNKITTCSIDEIDRISRDINIMAEKLEKAQQELIEREKLASLGEMAGGVAHELNNPIGVILNNIQMMKLDIEDLRDPGKEDIVESVQMIEEAAKISKSIVASLLNYSRRTDKDSYTSIDIKEIVKETCSLVKYRIKNIEFGCCFDENQVFKIKGNKTELIQVMTNLLANSIDAIEERKTTLENKEYKGVLTLTVNKVADKIILKVEDNGAGISEDYIAKIYDPFFTTKPPGKGTGLGLSITKKIIRGHGGTVDVSSKKGFGTKFVITIPSS